MESLLFFLVALGSYLLTSHLLHKIKNYPPTPFLSLPIIGHLYLLKKPLHRFLPELSTKYGPILLLWFGSRPVLIVASPSAAEECFSKNDLVFANRPRLRLGKHLGYNFTSLSWAPYGHHWRNLRRIAALELLSTRRLHMLVGIRSEEVKLLVRRLLGPTPHLEGVQTYQTVTMKSAFFELTLNVMMRMLVGKRYYGENTEDAKEAQRFKELVLETMRLSLMSNLGDHLPMFRWIGAGRRTEKAIEELHRRRDGFMQELVEEHICKNSRTDSLEADQGKQMCMLEVMLSLQETEPELYTQQTIRSFLVVMLAAGSDTSAGTMEWALSILLNNPDVLKKAQMEIDERVGHDRLLEESDLAQLPYLRCITNETLRIHPAAPLLVPHESSEECTVGGYRVPRGTMLLVNMWAIQNDPKVWAEPTVFRPERFEGLDTERGGSKSLPFGLGRRSCPGEGLAMRMIGLALGSLIQCFEWERVSEELVDMSEGIGLTSPKALPLMAKCRPRPAMMHVLSQL